MITHKDFESNCKRIAKVITKNSTDPIVLGMGKIGVHVSSTLIQDFNETGKTKYVREINKHLNGMNVKFSSVMPSVLMFYVEFSEGC